MLRAPLIITINDGPGAGQRFRFACNAGAVSILSRLSIDVMAELSTLKDSKTGPEQRAGIVRTLLDGVAGRPSLALCAVLLPEDPTERLRAYQLTDEELHARALAFDFLDDDQLADVVSAFSMSRLGRQVVQASGGPLNEWIRRFTASPSPEEPTATASRGPCRDDSPAGTLIPSEG